jgi:hypothetical protein
MDWFILSVTTACNTIGGGGEGGVFRGKNAGSKIQ